MTESGNPGQLDDDQPAAQLDEEPQGERGEPGSRDEGYGPGGGPADRQEGTIDEDTSVDSQGTGETDSPTMPSS